jgi:lambda family phage portal protein
MAFPFLSRLLRPFTQRSLEAASGSYRWNGRPASGDAQSWVRAGAGTVAIRAAHYALNNPHGARVVQVTADNVVGAGIKPKARADSPIINGQLHRSFDAWTDEADWSGQGDFYALQRGVVTDLVIHGEALLMWQTTASGLPQLQRLHPEQLDRSITRLVSDQIRIVQGVEFRTGDGRPVAYHVRPSAPGDPLAGMAAPAVRIPASTILHIFRPLLPGQVRGLSWLAPILLPGHEIDQLLDALLVRAKVSALHTGFIYNAEAGAPYSGQQQGDVLTVGMEPGTLVNLPSNKRIEFSSPPDSGNAPELAVSILRTMAAGVGLTYEQLTGDYSHVSYSSARAATLEFRRFCEAIQHHVMVFQFCRPVWTQFVRWQVLNGTVPASALMDPARGLQSAKWLPPKWPWVDPLKDANAAIREMEANLRSRSEVIAERGYDAEEVDAEIAEDRARADRLGIAPGAGNPAPPPAPARPENTEPRNAA